MVGAPKVLELGITRRCNSRCVICSHDPAWRGDMSLETATAIVDAFPETPEVQPHLFGEPTLHPDFLAICRMIKDRDKRLVEYTNGSGLCGEVLDGLVEMLTPGDIIIFSVEGYTKETYEAARRGLKFDTLLANVDAFQARKPAGVTSEVRMTEIREVDTEEAKAFWSQHVDLAWSVPEEPFGREVKGHFDIRYDSTTCKQTHEDMVVRDNGDVVMCCMDAAGDFPLGNVRDGARAVWWGAEFNRVRSEPHHLCSRCLCQFVNEER